VLDEFPKEKMNVPSRVIWNARTVGEERKFLQITGTFVKKIRVSTVPPNADVSVLPSINHVPAEMISKNGIELPLGQHQLRLTKPNYQEKIVTITVGEETNDSYTFTLERFVDIRAVRRGETEDIGADLRIFQGGGPGTLATTPIRLLLGPNVRIAFSKPGYKDTSVVLSPSQFRVAVPMSVKRASVNIFVRDSQTGKGLANAYLEVFDDQGKAVANKFSLSKATNIGLNPGDYQVKASRELYLEKTVPFSVMEGQEQSVVVELTPQ
jgi:uncharacterized surface anchored protein